MHCLVSVVDAMSHEHDPEKALALRHVMILEFSFPSMPLKAKVCLLLRARMEPLFKKWLSSSINDAAREEAARKR